MAFTSESDMGATVTDVVTVDSTPWFNVLKWVGDIDH